MYFAVQVICNYYVCLHLQKTLELGRSYLPLAVLGLDALEMWAECLPADVMRPYYADILPCFDAYLKSSAESGWHRRVTACLRCLGCSDCISLLQLCWCSICKNGVTSHSADD